MVVGGFDVKTPPGIYGATLVREATLHSFVVIWDSEVFTDAGVHAPETREFRDYNGHVIERA